MKRSFALKAVFAPENLFRTWKSRVWQAIRQQSCSDFIEYYDYNVDIKAHVQRLSPQIITGNYRPGRALSLHLNKADQLLRRTQVPTPDDALVFQALTEAILPTASASAPSKNAYFSRSHATPRGIQNMQEHPLYPWFKLWPKYQTKILDFAKAHKYLVVTDIQNFFDSVPHYAIDRALSNIGVDQGLRDLCLYMLEGYVERDLYAPLVQKGLPQLDFDAPRLLAHILLFNMDRYLEKKTKGSFARWVDDINFGEESISKSREILRTLERFLSRLELRLNGKKTQILSRQQAEEQLFVAENLKLTTYQAELKNLSAGIGIVENFYEDFLHFVGKGPQPGHWDQVLRRYINLLSPCLTIAPSSKKLSPLRKEVLVILQQLFVDHVDYRIRETIIRHLDHQKVSRVMLDFLLQQFHAVAKTDDVISFAIASQIASRNLTEALSKVVTKKLKSTGIRPGGLMGTAMLLCKFGDEEQICAFIRTTIGAWSTNDFLARQMISLWSILPPSSDASNGIKVLISRNVQRGPNDLIRFYEGFV